MSTIRELQDTLSRHAHDLHDDDPVGRAGAVHERVRLVRRRRRAAAGAGAALAVVTALGVGAWLPGADTGPAPADRELAGLTAPETLSALGYTYEFAGGVEGEGRVSISPREYGDGPMLVSWATGGDDDEVRIRTTGTTRVEQTADFEGYLPAFPGGDGRVTVHGEGLVALAVYTLDSSTSPPGPEGDARWPQRIAGDRLVGGAVGGSPVTVGMQMPEGDLAVYSDCTGVPTGLVVVEEIDGQPVTWGPCTEDDGLLEPGQRPASFSFADSADGPAPGSWVQLRIWVGEEQPGHQDPVPVTDAGAARLAIAGYAIAEPAVRVGNQELAELIESEGHRWRLTEHVVSEPGARALRAEAPAADAPVLVVSGIAHGSRGTSRLLRDGQVQMAHSNTASAGGGLWQHVPEWEPGHVYEVRAGSMHTDRSRLLLAFYERVD